MELKLKASSLIRRIVVIVVIMMIHQRTSSLTMVQTQMLMSIEIETPMPALSVAM